MDIPAVTAAGGALALDVAWAYLPLPENLKTGNLKYIAKAAGAVALAWAADTSGLVTKKTSDAMGVGALTVVFHSALKDMISRAMPQVRMDSMGYYNAATPAGTLDYNSGNAMGYYPANGNAASPEMTYNNQMGYYPSQ